MELLRKGIFMPANDIGIDLGTTNCLVYSTGKGLVLQEPSVVVYDKDTEKIRAIGEEAKQMSNHVNSNMEVIRPIRQGVIVDFVVLEKMLKYFITKAMGRRAFRKPRISVCVPSGITEIERKAVEEATYQAGAREVYLVEEPIAAAIGAGVDITKPFGNLIVDIGGGTTDISFFTIENNMPQVYDFFSINKGLNYLTCAEEKERKGYIVEFESEIDNSRKKIFTHEINGICKTILNTLLSELKKQTRLRRSILLDALQDRTIVYCGGGSTFPTLRVEYDGYKTIKLISSTEWNSKCVSQIDDIIAKNLCPILSTAYGLSISTEHDNIHMKPLKEIFEHVRDAEDDPVNNRFGQAYGGFSYGDDWDAWK